jgi:hypothetical protein
MDHLMRRRKSGPHSDRKVRQFFGCKLNDHGAALVRVAQDEPSGSRLFLVDAKEVRPVPQTAPLPLDYSGSESLMGSQGHIAFVSHESDPRVKPDLFLSDGIRTAACASAHNDPFDPERRFRGFGRLLALNARGQLLFEASIRKDEAGPTDNERLCLYTPALTADGKLKMVGESLQGEIRELARLGEALPGTDWTVSRNGFDWDGVGLSDSGDVVFGAAESDGMDVGSRCVAVLRHGSTQWEMLLKSDQPFGEPPQDIHFISLPSLNARGQVACVVRTLNRQTGEFSEQLIRIEQDGKRVVLARRGSGLEPGLTIETISAPQILADGKVVFDAALRTADSAYSTDSGLVVADDTRQRLILRESTLPVPDSQQPKIVEFRVNDRGQMGVHVEGDGFDDALLLVTPEFSSSANQRE